MSPSSVRRLHLPGSPSPAWKSPVCLGLRDLVGAGGQLEQCATLVTELQQVASRLSASSPNDDLNRVAVFAQVMPDGRVGGRFHEKQFVSAPRSAPATRCFATTAADICWTRLTVERSPSATFRPPGRCSPRAISRFPRSESFWLARNMLLSAATRSRQVPETRKQGAGMF